MTFGQYAYETFMQESSGTALWVELSPIEQQEWEKFAKTFVSAVQKACECDDCESKNIKIWRWF